MSSSTALLPKINKKDDHPIFLRVCHSPWVCISQKGLMFVRGFVAAYMISAFLMFIYYDCKKTEHGWLIPFEFSNISYLFQVVYSVATFSWTYVHLYYPHHGSSIPSHATRLQKFFSPPRQHPTTKNRTFFSIFYIAAVSYPHVVILVYWLILVPHKEIHRAFPLVIGISCVITFTYTSWTADGLLDQGWFRLAVTLNKFGINSAIALVEVFFLSSIRRQEQIWAHIFGLTILSLGYVGWAYIGKLLTGHFVYFFLNFHTMGWEFVIIAIASFCALTNIFFAVVYGITGLREMLTNTSYGYISLPQ